MANTARARGAGSTRAAPSAPAMKGPLHGMAMRAASAPVENAPRKPLVWLPRAANAGIGNSNRPARFTARSEERRVGKAGVGTGRSRGSPYHLKKTRKMARGDSREGGNHK